MVISGATGTSFVDMRWRHRFPRTSWTHTSIALVKFYNLYLDLVEAGVDWLAETTKACRRRGISPWVSARMNDTHGVENPEGSHFNCALLKKEEFRLSGAAEDPRDGLHPHWVAFDG